MANDECGHLAADEISSDFCWGSSYYHRSDAAVLVVLSSTFAAQDAWQKTWLAYFKLDSVCWRSSGL